MNLPNVKPLAIVLGLAILILVVAFNREVTENIIHILQAFPPIVYIPALIGKNAMIVDPPTPQEPQQEKPTHL